MNGSYSGSPYLIEGGVRYRMGVSPDDTGTLSETVCEYIAEHDGERVPGVLRVAVLGGRAAFCKLLAHWNRLSAGSRWTYRENA